MPKTKSGKPIPYQTGGGATRTSSEDTIYATVYDAKKRASEIGGFVVPHDADGDGVPDGYVVVNKEESTARRGPNPSELIPEENATLEDFETARDQAKYLLEVERRGKPRPPFDAAVAPDRPTVRKNMGGAVVDELGYTQGDMGFTKRGPVKYSKGGAVKGKTFSGIY